jgi:hypothetical protein
MQTGEQLKEAGIAQASAGNENWLQKVREFAKKLAKENGSVSINELRQEFCLPLGASPNLWGAVFKTREFKLVSFGVATHPSAHARRIGIYKI